MIAIFQEREFGCIYDKRGCFVGPTKMDIFGSDMFGGRNGGYITSQGIVWLHDKRRIFSGHMAREGFGSQQDGCRSGENMASEGVWVSI